MLTQKDIKFYQQKEDQTTVFRVHSIPGGMLYTNFDVSFGNYEYWIMTHNHNVGSTYAYHT